MCGGQSGHGGGGVWQQTPNIEKTFKKDQELHPLQLLPRARLLRPLPLAAGAAGRHPLLTGTDHLRQTRYYYGTMVISECSSVLSSRLKF